MTRQKSRSPEVNGYLLTIPEQIQPLYHKIRDCILDAEPDLEEAIKWRNNLTYLLDKKQLIKTVLYREKVRLIFYDGARIKDPEGVLLGSGNEIRTIKYSSIYFDTKTLKMLVNQAVLIRGVLSNLTL